MSRPTTIGRSGMNDYQIAKRSIDWSITSQLIVVLILTVVADYEPKDR